MKLSKNCQLRYYPFGMWLIHRQFLYANTSSFTAPIDVGLEQYGVDSQPKEKKPVD